MHYASPQLVDWSNPISDHPLNDGLVAWWMAVPGRQGWKTTTWRGLKGRHNGTLTNMDASTDWVNDSPRGGWGSLDFDGSSHGIDGPASSDIFENSLDGGTIAILCKPETASESRLLNFYNDASSRFALHWGRTSSKFGCFARNGSEGLIDLPQAGTSGLGWSLVCATAKTGSLKLFINGQLSATNGTCNDFYTFDCNSEPCTFGNYQQSSTFLNGKIAGVWAWRRAIAVSEVAEHYSQSQRHYPDLLTRRTRRTTVYVPAAGGSTSFPVFAHHYRTLARA